jgi:hypothetical protein
MVAHADVPSAHEVADRTGADAPRATGQRDVADAILKMR